MKVINSLNEIKWPTYCTVNLLDYNHYSIDFAGMVCR